jgi:hypothetical protein
MTPSREAIVLPGLFLTVTLLGGLRIADTVRLLPPSLTALVLAVLLLGALARGGVLLPHALMNPSRTAVENLSGAVVLLTVFAASAQAVNLLLPERGLLHAAFAIFLFCQIMTMHAAGVTRSGMLRSVLVLLGSMFVLRHIVVEALYAPDGGLLQRVLTTLMSGATLGGIAYDANAPVTGYVAFFTLVIYVVGLLLLPTAPPTTAMVRSHGTELALPAILLATFVSLAGCRPSPDADARADAAAPPARPAPTGLVSTEQRMAALRGADVWQQPAVPVGRANLKVNPAYAGAFKESDEVRCRLVVKPMNGTTPKFDCEIGTGDVIRVKYGRGNPELYAEVATTRLLSALGFGADRVYVVRKVACAGCNAFPFHALRCLAETGLESACFPGGVNHSQTTEFADVVVERRLEGRRIEAAENQGWAWYELEHVDAAAGGASRAEVDALELMAVLLAHWDNKAENQRLVCLPGGDLPGGGCSRPFAMLQDVGASFGPVKLDLQNWRALPVWADPKTCRVSMAKLPWGGGTFPEQHISEEGRQFLLRLLEQLSAAQIEDLFAGSGIDALEVVSAEGREPAAWAAAFQDKVRQIREAGPCG